MSETNLILNPGYTPDFSQISSFITGPAHELWCDFTSFIEENYQAVPKISYSKCSAKPGWNVKYQKSSKSICTLYPEEDRFIVLVVVGVDMVPAIEGNTQKFNDVILEMVGRIKPFNGTLWLMIPVDDKSMEEDVKRLLIMKQPPKKR